MRMIGPAFVGLQAAEGHCTETYAIIVTRAKSMLIDLRNIFWRQTLFKVNWFSLRLLTFQPIVITVLL